MHLCFPFQRETDAASGSPLPEGWGKARSRTLALLSKPTRIIQKRVTVTVGLRAVDLEPRSLDECWRGRMAPEFNIRHWKPIEVKQYRER